MQVLCERLLPNPRLPEEQHAQRARRHPGRQAIQLDHRWRSDDVVWAHRRRGRGGEAHGLGDPSRNLGLRGGVLNDGGDLPKLQGLSQPHGLRSMWCQRHPTQPRTVGAPEVGHRDLVRAGDDQRRMQAGDGAVQDLEGRLFAASELYAPSLREAEALDLVREEHEQRQRAPPARRAHLLRGVVLHGFGRGAYHPDAQDSRRRGGGVSCIFRRPGIVRRSASTPLVSAFGYAWEGTSAGAGAALGSSPVIAR